MKIKSVVSGLFEVNTYIVWCEETSRGVIIDPGSGTDIISSEVKQNNLKIEKILITHGHVDHTEGLGKLKKLFNVPFAIGKNDVETYKMIPAQSQALDIPITGLPEDPDILISEGDKIEFGNVTLDTMELPGHTAGSIAYYNNDAIFSGDVIFFNSIGRTDLPGGDYKTLFNSIRNKLFKLNPRTKIYPGHSIPTTIAAEIEENPFL
ncbi:MBL fold metallo-hydrolase [candidate division KSB1 bacterium]